VNESDTRKLPVSSKTPGSEPSPTPRRHRVSSSRRILVSNVQPQVEAGRHALRRIVGDRLRVRAEVLCDGDTAVRACIVYKVPGESRWRPAPMQPDIRGITWEGTLRLQNGGCSQFAVEAWVDVFATWQARLDALFGSPSAVDPSSLQAMLRNGVEILHEAMRSASGADLRLLADKSEALREVGDQAAFERWRHDRQLHKRMLVHGERRHVVRSEPVLEVIAERKQAACSTWCHLPPDSRLPDDAGATLRRIGVDILHRTGPLSGETADAERALEATERCADLRLPEALRPNWQHEHPTWFLKDAEPALSSGVIAVRPIDFWCNERDALWDACLDVTLQHIRRGARILVATHASRVPFAFWEWLSGRVHRLHPEVLFVSAPVAPEVARALARCGFSQTRIDWDGSLQQALHDIRAWARPDLEWRPRPTVPVAGDPGRAAVRGPRASEGRLVQLLAATSRGCFGIRGLPASRDAIIWLQTLAQWRRETHALQVDGNLELLSGTNPALFAFHRVAPSGRSAVVVVINTHPERQQEGEVDLTDRVVAAASGGAVEFEDLLDGTRYSWSAHGNYVRLQPHAAHVLRVVRRSRLLD
jgi:starch synthase (maltosyl-transferring)